MSHSEREFYSSKTRRALPCEFWLLILLILLPTRYAFGQGPYWSELIPPVPQNYTDFITPYFLNSNYGFVIDNLGYIGGVEEHLKRTTDGGASFEEVKIDDPAPLVSQLSFVSLKQGYAATSKGVYETLDGGNHWKLISSDRSYKSVYATGESVFATASTPPPSSAPLFYSSNGGVTWDSVALLVPGIFGNVDWRFDAVYGNHDSLVVIAFSSGTVDGAYLAYSLDLGHSWHTSPLGGGGTLHVLPHSCQIIRQCFAFEDPRGDEYDFLSGYPPYLSWDTTLEDKETSAWVAGNSCAMYIPVAAEDYLQEEYKYDFYRSTDQGATWQGIGFSPPSFEEIDDEDWPNLYAAGYGAVVYAGSWTGALYKTINGADGTLSESIFAPQIDFGQAPFATNRDTLFMTPCVSQNVLAYYENTRCAITEMDSISLEGLSTSEYTQTSPIHRTCGMNGDTIRFALHPADAGTRDITIHAHFTDDEFATIDTSIHFTLVVNSGVTVDVSLYLKPANLIARAGDTIDIPVYLNGTATLSGVTLATASLALNSQVLEPIAFIPSLAGVSLAGPLSYSRGTGTEGTETVPLQINNLQLNGETMIGSLRCVVYLNDSLQTSVSLVSASISSDDPRCLALSTSSDAVTIALTGCGDSTLLRFMQTGSPFMIESIVPNPAQNKITVDLSRKSEAPIVYDLFDELGRSWFHGLISGLQTSFSVTSLASGSYYIRVSTDGYVQTQKIQIER
jgi:hypothetical protein